MNHIECPLGVLVIAGLVMELQPGCKLSLYIMINYNF